MLLEKVSRLQTAEECGTDLSAREGSLCVLFSFAAKSAAGSPGPTEMTSFTPQSVTPGSDPLTVDSSTSSATPMESPSRTAKLDGERPAERKAAAYLLLEGEGPEAGPMFEIGSSGDTKSSSSTEKRRKSELLARQAQAAQLKAEAIKGAAEATEMSLAAEVAAGEADAQSPFPSGP